MRVIHHFPLQHHVAGFYEVVRASYTDLYPKIIQIHFFLVKQAYVLCMPRLIIWDTFE